uniref:Large ribosomal subunit protein uL15/eL18 domain-containing protein n=1 Tax=Rhizochromulina marina TaxID=1034831 RepID=A0A6U0WPW9_9STRA|mmetsp:Transcript_10881/g.31177  ORF Transcript_10881/g.31177 Transcript_10881/m.31177 type:complete len:252 (+) Transcript_10881:167-922(+)
MLRRLATRLWGPPIEGALAPGGGGRGLPRWFSTPARLTLNMLRDNAGANRPRKRKGRGVGSGLGKTSGRGHKGQKARAGRNPFLGFEGGQTPLYRILPKRGFTNKFAKEYASINVGAIQDKIDAGALRVPTDSNPLTMRDLVRCGLTTRLRSGVKLLGEGKERVTTPLHVEVSRASQSAITAIEGAGGSITCVYYNPIALRSLMFPEKFQLAPRIARPPPKLMPFYLDYQNRGFLSPEIQLRKQLQKLGRV